MSTWRPRRPPGEETPPRPVGESLESFARRLGVPQAASLAVVFDRWAEVVGDSVAAHARPVSLVKGTLVVAVDQPAWATQLRYLAPQLAGRLNEAAGAEVVERLEMRVERPGRRG